MTDDLRLWSACALELLATPLLLTIAGATDGTAGGIDGLPPFTGETEFDLPCCWTPPTATAGELEATTGGPCLFVAFAYDVAAGCACTALGRGDAVPDAEAGAALFRDCSAAFMGLGAEETVLVIRAPV